MMSHEPAAPSVAIPKVLGGQKAIVTGCSSGKGIALALGEAGADVMVNFHSGGEAAKRVAEEIQPAARTLSLRSHRQQVKYLHQLGA